jgi:AcrR family transcriptional regulator
MAKTASALERARPAKVAKAEATRRGLLKAARKLFGKQGYASTSVDEVVRAAGVTKGALYHHFRDKDDLFRAVVEQVKVDVTSTAANSYFDDSQGDDPLARVRRLCIAMIDAHLDTAVQRISITDARAVFDPSTRRDLDTRYEVSLLRGALRGAMRAGAIEQQPLAPLAHLVAGALIEACALIAEADDQATSRAEVLPVLLRLVDGLQPRT